MRAVASPRVEKCIIQPRRYPELKSNASIALVVINTEEKFLPR
jgi:hypothetical protein